MATTTNYGWETPDDTDLVKDGASAIRTLGSSIDTTTKALNPSTTLGDIEYRSSTANTNTRLPIGTTGQVLTVSGGVPAWSTSNSFYPFINTSVSQTYLRSPSGSIPSQTITAGITFYVPVFLDGTNFDRIGVRGGTGFSGTATVRLGIYNASISTQKPTTVYLDAGTVSVTGGSNFEITINSTPPVGYYYLAFNCQTAASTNTFLTHGTDNAITQIFGSLNGTVASYFQETVSVTGGFATAATLTSTTQPPLVALRIA